MVGKYSVKNQLAYFMEWEPDIAVIIRLSSRRKYYTTKRFFSNILIKIATANKQRNITQHKKSFFSIILIEMATANVQENITQHKKNIFLA